MPHRIARRIAHGNDFGRVNDPQTFVVADDPRDESAQFGFVTDENEFEIGVLFEARGSRAHDDLGAEIAAHGID